MSYILQLLDVKEYGPRGSGLVLKRREWPSKDLRREDSDRPRYALFQGDRHLKDFVRVAQADNHVRRYGLALTDEQRGALERFARSHGPRWKSILRNAWMRHDYGDALPQDRPHLAGLRNFNYFGPQGLIDYRPAKEPVSS